MAYDSAVALPAGAMAASAGMADDEIRDASIWYLVRGYAQDPAAIHDPLRAALLAPRTEAASDREDFGRELLRRMLGEERKDNDRWMKFLASDEADRLLQNESVANAVMTDARCNDEWLGVGTATVDGSGRVTKLDRSGGEVKAPVVKKRVEPFFPQSARQGVGGHHARRLRAEPEADEAAPFGEINGSALLALSQWTFVPAYYEGKPVDAFFNLTINFRLN